MQRPPTPRAHASCNNRRVAEGPVASVDVSDCGMVSIHLGAFTLRVTREALMALQATLSEAAARLGEPELGARDDALGAFMRPGRGNA